LETPVHRRILTYVLLDNSNQSVGHPVWNGGPNDSLATSWGSSGDNVYVPCSSKSEARLRYGLTFFKVCLILSPRWKRNSQSKNSC
jgi:hypothetical protein